MIYKLILKMMMVNILSLSIFQSAYVIALPQNEKTTCDEKEGQLQLIGQSPAAIDDEVYDEVLNCLHANMILKYRHNMSSSEVYTCIYDPVYSRETNCCKGKRSIKDSASKRRSR